MSRAVWRWNLGVLLVPTWGGAAAPIPLDRRQIGAVYLQADAPLTRSFIGRLDHTGANCGIVKAIVTLARDLGLKVVAEGVETAEQLAIVRPLGCEYAQGYLFSRSIGSAAATPLLESKPLW